MQKTRDHPNSRSGYVKEDVLKAISGFFIILAFIAVISLFAGMGGSSGGTSNSGSSDSKVIFVVNDMLLEAPKDTTWEEFVSNESLNTPGFTIVDGNVYLGDSKVIDSETNLPVTPDMPIDSNIEYKDESYIGGSDNNSGSNTGGSGNIEPITTLKGTTWYVKSGWLCDSSSLEIGQYYEDWFTINGNGASGLHFGYHDTFNGDFTRTPTANCISVYNSNSVPFINILNTSSITIEFLSNDCPFLTDTFLINWLQTYGERINGGNSSNSAKIITFTINGQEYLAEEGMTFADWSDTVYNTSDYVADASMNKVTNYANVLGGVTCDTVIVQGASYSADLGGY